MAAGGGGSWSLILYRFAAGTLITHPIHVFNIYEKAYYSHILATIYTLSMYLEHLSKHLSSINKQV